MVLNQTILEIRKVYVHCFYVW